MSVSNIGIQTVTPHTGTVHDNSAQQSALNNDNVESKSSKSEVSPAKESTSAGVGKLVNKRA